MTDLKPNIKSVCFSLKTSIFHLITLSCIMTLRRYVTQVAKRGGNRRAERQVDSSTANLSEHDLRETVVFIMVYFCNFDKSVLYSCEHIEDFMILQEITS